MDPGTITKVADSAKLPATNRYREIIGSLLFIATRTRLDILIAVNYLSKFTSDPLKIHLQAAKRILRYLKGSSHLNLTLWKATNSIPHAFVDANWGPMTRRSVTGWTILINTSLVSWQSIPQKTVALSTMEAEYGPYFSNPRDRIH